MYEKKNTKNTQKQRRRGRFVRSFSSFFGLSTKTRHSYVDPLLLGDYKSVRAKRIQLEKAIAAYDLVWSDVKNNCWGLREHEVYEYEWFFNTRKRELEDDWAELMQKDITIQG